MALWPFVITKAHNPTELIINHERIHLQQQRELLLVFFYLWYGLEWMLRFLAYKNMDLAYRNICFEREAYSNEIDLDYLKKRSMWRFLHYINNKI